MILDHKNKKALELAIHYLKNDNLFIYPTDTLYGFGGNARSDQVLDLLYDIKNRPVNMPVSLLARDVEMIREYAVVSKKTEKLASEFLPGALTMVLPSKNNTLPKRLFNVEGFLGFRIPNHEFCNHMSAEFDNPIITTSVNKSGSPALNDIKSIHDQFGDKIKLYISDRDLEQKGSTTGSTVVMIDRNDHIKILREGVISRSQIINILR